MTKTLTPEAIKFRQLREQSGLWKTRISFAEEIGVATKTVLQWENGTNKIPAWAFKLVEALTENHQLKKIIKKQWE